jgi:predicted enzyme related to lactoylglutathione lyase
MRSRPLVWNPFPMSHRSRLTSVLVDVPAADHERAVAFWSAAFGRKGETPEKFPEYVALGEPTPGIEFMIQATNDATPRIHIDIESDDVEAEVARLQGLGATEIERHHTWVVMRDPAGTVFCVVRVQLKDAFEQHATVWD